MERRAEIIVEFALRFIIYNTLIAQKTKNSAVFATLREYFLLKTIGVRDIGENGTFSKGLKGYTPYPLTPPSNPT